MNHPNSCTPLALISQTMNHFIGPAKQVLSIRIMAVTINDIKNLHCFDNKNQIDVSLNCRTQRTVFPMDKCAILLRTVQNLSIRFILCVAADICGTKLSLFIIIQSQFLMERCDRDDNVSLDRACLSSRSGGVLAVVVSLSVLLSLTQVRSEIKFSELAIS